MSFITRLQKFINKTTEHTNQQVVKQSDGNNEKIVAYCINFALWKRELLEKILNQYQLKYVSFKSSVGVFSKKLLKDNENQKTVILVWGKREIEGLRQFSDKHGIPLYHMEDGFIRSVGLGKDHVLPYSLCLDKTGIYYDATSPSDLEKMIQTRDFSGDGENLEKARMLINIIRNKGISKYNLPDDNSFGLPPKNPEKAKKRVLVLAQNDNDASIVYGCKENLTSMDMLKKVVEENPDSEIFYKCHPDLSFDDEIKRVHNLYLTFRT